MRTLLKNIFRLFCVVLTIVYFVNCLFETGIDFQTFMANLILLVIMVGGGFLGYCLAQFILLIIECVDYYYDAQKL
jgi:hypothetical protein